MSSVKRVDPFSLSALRFHVPLLIGIALCTFAGLFELSRARAGHTIAWVYTFEWPAFAVVGTYIWWQMITNAEASRPSGPVPGAQQPDLADDPGLAAWRQYLTDVERREQVHGVDPAD